MSLSKFKRKSLYDKIEASSVAKKEEVKEEVKNNTKVGETKKRKKDE